MRETPLPRIDAAPLCHDAWDLGPQRTKEVEARIEALVAADELTDSAVAQVLCSVGVTQSSAVLIAPSIRMAIVA